MCSPQRASMKSPQQPLVPRGQVVHGLVPVARRPLLDTMRFVLAIDPPALQGLF